MADYPRKRYHEIRALKKKPIFIEARFKLPLDLRGRIAELLKVSPDRVSDAVVSRNFGGEYSVSFPQPDEVPTEHQRPSWSIFARHKRRSGEARHTSDEEPLRDPINTALQAARALAESSGEAMTADTLAEVRAVLAVDVSDGRHIRFLQPGSLNCKSTWTTVSLSSRFLRPFRPSHPSRALVRLLFQLRQSRFRDLPPARH